MRGRSILLEHSFLAPTLRRSNEAVYPGFSDDLVGRTEQGVFTASTVGQDRRPKIQCDVASTPPDRDTALAQHGCYQLNGNHFVDGLGDLVDIGIRSIGRDE